MTAPKPKTWQQRRGDFVLGVVDRFLQDNNDAATRQKLRQLASRLPMMVRTNSLGQAAAWLHGQDDAGRQLLSWITAWFTQHGPYRGTTDLVKSCMTQSQQDYFEAQAEAMKLLGWVKLIVVAKIPKETSGG